MCYGYSSEAVENYLTKAVSSMLAGSKGVELHLNSSWSVAGEDTVKSAFGMSSGTVTFDIEG